MTILDQLTGCARERTVQAKLRISLEELKQQDNACCFSSSSDILNFACTVRSRAQPVS